jgi:hypothetical protein
MALAVVAVVGLAVDAQVAAASAQKPGLSVSVKLGPVTVKTDASTNGLDAGVSTPPASVDATVDPTSSTAPVPATVDSSTPVADIAVTATVGPTVQVDASASTPVGSAAVQTGTSNGIDASVQVKTPVTTGKVAATAASGKVRATTKISTAIGDVNTAVDVSTPAPSNGSTAAAAQAIEPLRAVPQAVTTHAASSVVQHVRQKAHPLATSRPPAPRRSAHSKAGSLALSATSTASASLLDSVGAFGHAVASGSGSLLGAFLVAEGTPLTQDASERAPRPQPGSGSPGGATGSGPSTTVFFVILSALLMLAAPFVGRWLRPSIGLALQPAFASLPERPG